MVCNVHMCAYEQQMNSKLQCDSSPRTVVSQCESQHVRTISIRTLYNRA